MTAHGQNEGKWRNRYTCARNWNALCSAVLCFWLGASNVIIIWVFYFWIEQLCKEKFLLTLNSTAEYAVMFMKYCFLNELLFSFSGKSYILDMTHSILIIKRRVKQYWEQIQPPKMIMLLKGYNLFLEPITLFFNKKKIENLLAQPPSGLHWSRMNLFSENYLFHFELWGLF